MTLREMLVSRNNAISIGLKAWLASNCSTPVYHQQKACKVVSELLLTLNYT